MHNSMQQLVLLDFVGADLLEGAHQRLVRYFDDVIPRERLDPLSQLILSMLGGRTLGAVSRAAFKALRDYYPIWEMVRDAPQQTVLSLIQEVTFADAKADSLQRTLHQITALNGCLDLRFLRLWDVENALAWLEQLPGVDRKAAAAALNFSTIGAPCVVIDTHHLRVLKRMRWVGPKATLANAYDMTMETAPEAWATGDFEQHHYVMKRLGQTYCTLKNPQCGECPLRSLCPTGAMRAQTQRVAKLTAWSVEQPKVKPITIHTRRAAAHTDVPASASSQCTVSQATFFPAFAAEEKRVCAQTK